MTSKLAWCPALVLVLCLYPPGLIAQIIGPSYKPGDTMTKTDHESVDNALDDVLSAGGILEGRRCAIGIANLGTTDLTAPQWYVESGSIYSSAPYTISTRQTGLTLFHKKSFATYGTNGLLSYDIAETDYKLVILWEVPWNMVLYDVKFNLQIYRKSVPTDKDLFQHIYKYGGTGKSIGWLGREEYGIKVLGSITESTFSKLYVSVDASAYSVVGSPDLHTECDTNVLWFGSYCWQECRPSGYCWVNRKCNSAADCTGPLSCYESCKKT